MRATRSLRRVLLDSEACRKRIREFDGYVNAFVRTSPLPTPAGGRGTKKLEGWPVGIKDSICTEDLGTGCSSRMLENFEPGYDATVVKLLRAHGADILGKTNCDEFGMGSMNTHSIHGPVLNPLGTPASFAASTKAKEWTREMKSRPRVAGGSSGGSAAAVAAGMCQVALGTDTGGSTRLPAAYCGVVGLKPSYGLLSRWGVVSFADSLDCVGILGRDVESVKEVFDVLNVHDGKDPTSASVERREAARERSLRRIGELGLEGGRVEGLRVGVPVEYFPEEMTEEVKEKVRRTLMGLREKGAEIVPVSLPSTEYALSAYYVLASAEASSCLARYDGVEYGMNVSVGRSAKEAYAATRSAGFGKEVKRRILLGTYALSADAFDNYFLQARRVREMVRRDFERVFGGVDVLVHASVIQDAPRLGERQGLSGYVQDVLTVAASLGGVSGMSVGGVSIVGGWGNEEIVFLVGSHV